MVYEYKDLLDRAWSKLPEKLHKHERFEIPAADVFIEGNRTIVRNFDEIAADLRRDPEELFKYLLKESASRGSLEKNRAVIQRRLKPGAVNDKINKYACEYILCHECKRPDTYITELAGEKIIKCEACGAHWHYKRIK